MDGDAWTISVRRWTARDRSPTARDIALRFGLSIVGDAGQWCTMFDNLCITTTPGHLTAIVGPSGCGKSTLLGVLTRLCPNAIRLDHLKLPATRLVDGLSLPIDDAIRVLARAGLSDAPLMLRRPRELSDGQRYRYRLALAFAHAEKLDSPIILADEFLDTLDRATARVLASNVRRWVTQRRIAMIVATSKIDLLRPLRPDTIIEKPLLGEAIVVDRAKFQRKCTKVSS